MNAAIAALWLRQRGEMLRRVEVISTAVAALDDGGLAPDQREEAERAAHKIAGSAGSFGFADASLNAREIELALRDQIGGIDAGRLAELVARLERDFAHDPGAHAGEDRRPDESAQTIDVLLLGAATQQFEAELTGRGLRVAIAPADEPPPNAAIAVVQLAEPGVAEFMAAVKDDPGVCVIGLADATGLTARVDFTRRGGRTLLPSDVPPREVAEAVVALRERLAGDSAHVLVVDDDEGLLDLTATILRGHGLRVTPLSDPGQFWQRLETLDPDVLLLDLEMPGFNGLELCAAVRSDPRWAQLPVLFLTARTDAQAVRAVFAAGADDYMSKPVIEEELVQRIRNRLERVGHLRDLADRDPLTGVPNRRKSSEQLERLEGLAKRYGQPLTLAMLDLDHFKRVNDSFGHDTGDAVLRRLGRRLQSEFRGEDVIGRWGGEEFVIGMYGMSGKMAVERLEGLLEAWKQERFDDTFGGSFSTSFTIGLAELPGTADSLDELQQAADDALYRGKSAGRSRVQAAGDGDGVETEVVDVVVVDDDHALAELLLHALGTEGWSVARLDDGPSAIDALADDPPRIQGRLVLLDWDLPGVSGLDVLGTLRERGALARTRVVMLTARRDDAEVLKALELGATDHIAKPFSVPVLLQKLRQHIEAR